MKCRAYTMKRAKKSRKQSDNHKFNVDEEIEILSQRIAEEAPARGYVSPLSPAVTAFSALPISQNTIRGLDDGNFVTMTAIQNACIPHALAQRDILGAARTGSGKTLAFLVPVLECLYRNKFIPADGPGAVILSPTRELAIQIFQVLRKVGKHHTVSVGLLIGGRKDFYEEQQHIGNTNIIIATPGRLLQHLEQTPYLDMGSLQILVLDEADRILDLGFRDQLVRILDYLPKQRQTLLFSATQTRDVSSLATLSLQNPEYLGVHDKEKTSTPESLQQSYVVVPQEHKLNAVYSFIKTHLKSKSIIFFGTCAQVRHAHDLFCSIRPGITVMAIHGKVSQERRTKIYFDFLKHPHAVLFATDIAARGLDFPNVDWVVQADAPEDRDMYIHRAGRTARYRSGGKSLLILTPSEEKNGFIDLLQGKGSNKLPLKKLGINPTKATIVTERASSLVASNVDLNTLAKKSFQSYIRSIHLMPHKEIFKVKDIDLDAFSKSLGLASTPNLQFLKTAAKDRSEFREKKNVNKKLQKLKEQIKAEKLAKKIQKLGKTAPESVDKNEEDGSDTDDDLLLSKNRQQSTSTDDAEEDLPDAGLHQVRKPRSTKKICVTSSNANNRHIVFNDDGEAQDLSAVIDPTKNPNIENDNKKLEEATESYLGQVRARLESSRAQDLADEKERIRQKHKKRKLKEKEERRNDSDDGPLQVTLGSGAGDEQESVHTNSSDDMSSSDDDSSQSSTASQRSLSLDDTDIKKQEEMALALIRGQS